MLVITRKRMSLLVCTVLNLFIFFDIINGAGKVPPVFMRMDSLFLALYCAVLYGAFVFVIKWKIDKIQLFILWIMVWQLSVAIFIGNEITLNMIYQITGWPLLFIVVYQLTRKNAFTLPGLKYISLLWIVASGYVVYILRTQMFNDVYRTYYLIIAIPFFICLDKKWKYSRLLLIFILITLTYKRTGFMAFIIASGMCILCDINNQKKDSKKIKKMFLLFILLLILIIMCMRFGNSMAIIRRIKKITSDNGSDRFTIWLILINHFKSSSLSRKVIGNGYKSCYWILNGIFSAAHNDFIEILIDYGLIGLANHMIFIILIGKKMYELIKSKTKEACGIVYMFSVWIVLMLFSFVTWQSILMKPIAMYFAYMLAKYKYNIDGTVINGEKNVKLYKRYRNGLGDHTSIQC